jgi:hypothetical protein
VSAPPNRQPSLDEYLDGTLSQESRAAFEKHIAADPSLAAQVRLQRRIDESLGRLFAATDRVSVARAPEPRRLSFRPMIWSIAAVLTLAAAVALYFGMFGSRSGPLDPLYQAQLASHFVPAQVCTTGPEFAKWVKDYYGQALYPADDHPGVEFVGWNYGRAVSPSSGVLLAKVDGKEVIVVVDRKAREKSPLPPARSGLHSFRQEYGSLVLYEVTPLDYQAILPLLSTQPGRGN